MRRTLTVLLALALSLLLATPALATLSERLVNDFGNDGTLDVCKYTPRELGQAKDIIASDTDAYDPDFRTAVDAMIERRAQGACDKKKPSTPSTASGDSTGAAATPGGGSSGTPSTSGTADSKPGAPGATPSPDTPVTAAPLIAGDSIAAEVRGGDGSTVPPVPVIALAILGALLVLGALLLAAVRWTGWEPAWAERARHAAGEAGWRASSTWAEFTDFVRFGR